ncbi:MAG TPA: hypothetical protein GX010_01785, partial [Erysipelotrichaceae bacterium]|nr:hypothetical protein [Erysipelotrichaceae bacterium]
PIVVSGSIEPTEQEPDTKVSVEDNKPEIVEEPPAPKKVRKPRAKKVEPVEQDKTPVVEEKPKEEMEQAKENKTENSQKKKAPAKKKAETKKTASQKVKREKILGKFIVKTNKGYYVNENSYSVYKDDAKVFDDFNAAQDVKNQHGGKVVKV